MSHALLGPSSAKQWMTCTPSARFGEGFPDRSSEYADEGSAAHQLAEMCVSGRAGIMGLPGHLSHDEWTKQYAAFTNSNRFWCDEMDEVIKEFADWVVRLLKTKKNPVLLLEQRLDLSRWIPSGYGTGDVIIVDDTGLLEVIDLKYGKGVPVQAEDNPQLKCYALGAVEALDVVFNFDKVKVTIYQARLLDPDSDPPNAEYDLTELLEWADRQLKPAAELAWEGHGDFVPGDHCRFCRGRAECRARIEQEARAAFDDAYETPESVVDSIKNNRLTEEEFLYWLDRADAITKAMKDIKDSALKKAAAGETIPGYKLVAGRSNRGFRLREKVIEILAEQANPDRFWKPKVLLGPGAVEKELGAKNFKALLGEYVVKPPGKPTLVPESDGRPALDPSIAAESAFGDEEEED